MTRSIWKGPFVGPDIQDFDNLPERIHSRQTTILPSFVGQTVQVHNGQGYVNLSITSEMIGHKFGEFAVTRKKPTHKKN